MNVTIKIAYLHCCMGTYCNTCYISDAEEHFMAGISYDDTLVCKVGKYKPSPGDELTSDSIYNFILSSFEQVNIRSGDKVAVIFDEEGKILALSKMKEDVWLDVTDGFKKKSFAELNIDITSLKVY